MAGFVTLTLLLALFWVYDDVLDKVLHYPMWARIIHGIAFSASFSFLALAVAKTLGIPL